MKLNTKKYEQIITQVLVDDRENERVDYALSMYSPFNPIKKHLDVGDYIFKGHNGVEVVFEYKEEDDFITSITGENNHLHNQTYEMITNFDYTFIMVQCEDLRKLLNDRYYKTGQDISFQQVNGATSEFNTVSTVLYAQTRYQAFDMMMRQAGKMIERKPFKYKYGKKSRNVALNYLSAMKGVGKRADNIVETLNLSTVEDLLNVTKEELLQVDLIGEKTANMILSYIRGHSK